MIWSLRGGNRCVDFRSCVRIMGILNVTHDSFYDGGRYDEVGRAVDQALLLEAEGADIIDIGGESSRPPMYGVAAAVCAGEECRRVVPVIEGIRTRSQVPVSVDTTKAEVAREALAAGADIINDISALGDAEMASVAAEAAAPVILMHRRGTPATMQLDTRYDDLLGEISGFFRSRIEAATAAGVDPRNLAVDPGLGFGKSVSGNLTLIAELSRFRSFGCPIVVGPSPEVLPLEAPRALRRRLPRAEPCGRGPGSCRRRKCGARPRRRPFLQGSAYGRGSRTSLANRGALPESGAQQ